MKIITIIIEDATPASDLSLPFVDCPASTTVRPIKMDERLTYCSPVLEGYDTVLGWYAKQDPWALLIGELWNATHTQRDGFWLMHRCRERAIPVLWVPAPAVLRDQGIKQVRAYPISLLRERMEGVAA
jgi:hypothetical protein